MSKSVERRQLQALLLRKVTCDGCGERRVCRPSSPLDRLPPGEGTASLAVLEVYSERVARIAAGETAPTTEALARAYSPEYATQLAAWYRDQAASVGRPPRTCDECTATELCASIDEGRKERAARAAAQVAVTPLSRPRKKAGEPKVGPGTRTRPSLSPEGNVPLVVRLIREGRAAGTTKKEIRRTVRRTFRKLYAAIGGKTDREWIRSRTKLYMARALAKIRQEDKA